jgi:hypothetical protein
MNTLSRFFALVILASYALTLNAKEEPPQTSVIQPAQQEHYVNAEKGFALDYPANWKKSDIPQLDFILFAPSTQANGFPHASMNIVSEKVGAEVTLEQFYKESADNLQKALKDVNVEKSGSSNLSGVPVKWLLYTHNMQGVTFRVIQYFVVANESIYLITFSAANDAFDSYLPAFEEILRSFKLQETPAKT